MRSGTDNVSGAAGLGVAAEKIYRNLEENTAHMQALRDYFTEQLEKMDDVVVHGTRQQGAPHIVNVSFVGVRSEVLLHTLEDRNIYVSAGSACSTHKRSGSPTLTALGIPRDQMESSVRFSFVRYDKRGAGLYAGCAAGGSAYAAALCQTIRRKSCLKHF